ncbi:hypothetical protein DQ04_00681000 [Trypanosoma grayi]|uniref:hypothetical protein n=1 Tax=Trypanosoma grayi TaxID=71804 RepID=UPI0004F4B415|nr:hypothetical protein DQ04_00681000 [Trypanosoma grayi]KEG13976.1 hypothetical protein DQ04_00681000 [Trypanosoma grayi]
MRVRAGVIGDWNVSLMNGQAPVLFAQYAFRTLRVQPPDPFVESATGSCADSSASCVTGAQLTFHGANFNSANPSYNDIGVGSNDAENPILCRVIAVSETQMSCELSIPHDKDQGTYPVGIRTRVSVTEWGARQNIGFLVLGAGEGVPGLRVDVPPQPIPGGGEDKSNNTAVVVGVVLGTLLLLLIVAMSAVYFCRRSAYKEEVEEMISLEQQLLRAERESVQSLKKTKPLEEL